NMYGDEIYLCNKAKTKSSGLDEIKLRICLVLLNHIPIKNREIDDDYFSFFILGKNYFFIAFSTA
ncbi:TPA: hypothetical protein ACGDO1_003902, partial [Acinetobacter baumannii]